MGPGSKQVCTSALQEWRLSSLQPSNKPPLFSNQLKGANLPNVLGQDCLTWAWTPDSFGRIPEPGIPPLFLGHLLRVWVRTRSSPSPHQTLGSFLYSLDCRRVMLLVFRSFSARVVLYVALICSWCRGNGGIVSSGSSYSAIWSPPSWESILTPAWAAEGFPGGSDGTESTCNAGDLGLILGLGRSPGGGYGYPLQYSCLENLHGQRSLAGCSLWGCKDLNLKFWRHNKWG